MRSAAAIATLVIPLATSAHEPIHLTVIEHASNETVIHRVGDTDSLGDLIIFSNPLFDSTEHHELGTSSGQCVRTLVGVAWECQFTLRLERGALMVSGRYDDEGDSTIAVVGGTAGYSGARGTLVIHPKDEAHTRYDFIATFQPTGH